MYSMTTSFLFTFESNKYITPLKQTLIILDHKCLFKLNEACEGFDVIEDNDSDGNQWDCIQAQKSRGMNFATIVNGLCYGSMTCKKPIQFDNAISYQIAHCTGT